MQATGPYTDGAGVLSEILRPHSPDEFFEHTWEKLPLFITRPLVRQWYSDWLSRECIFELLADEDADLQYGLNLDVTAYNGQVRTAMHTRLSDNIVFGIGAACANNLTFAGETRLQLQQ